MARIRRNLINMRFGKLVAIEYKGTDKFRNAEWLCECDCGNRIIEKGTLLTNGKVVSCGKCDNKYNFDNPQKTEVDTSLIGERFARLLVIDEYTKKDENGKDITICKCRCDCGNEIEIQKNRIRSGGTKSCGCLHKDKLTNTLFNLKLDRIGERYGLLKIVSYDTDKKMWKCECDCGNITYIKRFNGNTRSCGCLKQMSFEEREKAIKKGENNIE